MKGFRFVVLLLLVVVVAAFAQRTTSHKQRHHSVSLAWNASPSPNVTYDVFRTPEGFSSWGLIQSGITADSFVDNSVAAGQSYTYEVMAVGQNGQESVASNEVSVTVP